MWVQVQICLCHSWVEMNLVFHQKEKKINLVKLIEWLSELIYILWWETTATIMSICSFSRRRSTCGRQRWIFGSVSRFQPRRLLFRQGRQRAWHSYVVRRPADKGRCWGLPPGHKHEQLHHRRPSVPHQEADLRHRRCAQDWMVCLGLHHWWASVCSLSWVQLSIYATAKQSLSFTEMGVIC